MKVKTFDTHKKILKTFHDNRFESFILILVFCAKTAVSVKMFDNRGNENRKERCDESNEGSEEDEIFLMFRLKNRE